MAKRQCSEVLYTGEALGRAFHATMMSRKELADRLQLNVQHVSSVFQGRKPVSPTFQLRVLQVIRMAQTGTLPLYVPPPKREKPKVGYCGSGANLPEDYEPLPASSHTNAAAGSADKVAEMRRRAERGEELFNPRDNQMSKRLGDD